MTVLDQKVFRTPDEFPGAAELDDDFQDFIQEVDDILINLTPEEIEAIPDQQAEAKVQSMGAAAITDEDYDEMRATFMEIMKQTLKPVTRYVKAIINGLECREIFEVINFTVTPLIEKVEQVGLFERTSSLLNFKAVLARILATHFGTLAEEAKQELVNYYMEVNHAFDLGMRGNVRAVNNILGFYRLLSFNPQIEVEHIRRFFAIGIPSVTWVRRTSGRELSSLSGIPLAEAHILKKLARSYREPMAEEFHTRVYASAEPMVAL